MIFRKTLPFLLVYVVALNFGFSQSTHERIAYTFLIQDAQRLSLEESDIADAFLTTQHTSDHNGVTHLYFQQAYNNIPIHNAIYNLAIKDSRVVYSNSTFIPNASSKINTVSPSLSVEEAITKGLMHLELQSTSGQLELKERISDRHFVFKAIEDSHNEIICRLNYMKDADDHLILVWQFAIDVKGSADYWSLGINAIDGSLQNQFNYTVYCNHHRHEIKNSRGKLLSWNGPHCDASVGCQHDVFNSMESSALVNNASYKVFALPVESPVHGTQTTVSGTSIPNSSIYGWHDTDGIDGPEFTITRGNNVWAYADRNDDNVTDLNEPDGGVDLQFDFDYDSDASNTQQLDAAQTQLFYMNNMMHDITYVYGFTSAAGNFQNNNYGLLGEGDDEVMAEAQDGALLQLDAFLNNANFATPPDGLNPRMQMYLWEPEGGISPVVFKVIEPVTIAGIYENVGLAQFGPSILGDEINITEQALLVDDGEGIVTDACTEIMNDLTGKIALIDRGSCAFSEKVLRAQNQGAIAAVICNNIETNPPAMSGGIVGNDVTIPSVHIPKEICDVFKLTLEQGLPITIELGDFSEGSIYLDSDFDNGVIAHEYAHGISNRLTAGAFNTSCLSNAEQMGEGWSDFFALLMGTDNGNQGADTRGIAVYVNDEEANGSGIREFPFSTDMSRDPRTYDFIKNSDSPHSIGGVWCSMIWDLYWKLVAEYGYDSDFTNLESGNAKALLLVMDGMKLQSCNPGFIDGRNAILAADNINFEGENTCLIWEVFARRGLGFFADQGSSNDTSDGTEDFSLPESCIVSIKDIDQKLLDVQLFPNPASSSFTLSVTADHSMECVLTLSSLDGKKVLESEISISKTTQEVTLNISQIPKGIYFLKGDTESGTFSKKLIVN